MSAVTLGRVARELGCHVTSLYTHVDSIDDLHMRMAVDEYWVVDLDGRQIERWFKGQPNAQVERGVMTWQLSGAEQPLTIDLPQLFTSVGLKKRL